MEKNSASSSAYTKLASSSAEIFDKGIYPPSQVILIILSIINNLRPVFIASGIKWTNYRESIKSRAKAQIFLLAIQQRPQQFKYQSQQTLQPRKFQMHNCLKFLWLISLYGIIFFTFTSITFVTGPQYYDFPITDETKNSNIILIFLYLILFFILSVKWRRDRNFQGVGAGREIEMKPLRGADHHHQMEEMEIQ